jgi:hypothetical protein
VTSPDTYGEYAFLAAAGVALGGAGYLAYKSWATSEPAQQLSRYGKFCPPGQLKYRSAYGEHKIGCVDDRLIAGGFCTQRVFGNAGGTLYCADAPISKGDVEFTEQLRQLYDAMRAAEVTDAERKEAEKKVFEAQLDEMNAKAKLASDSQAQISADFKDSVAVVQAAAKQEGQIAADIAVLKQKQAALPPAAADARASIQVQLNAKDQEALKVAADASAKVSANTSDMKAVARGAAVKGGAIEKATEDKLAHISKKVPLVGKRKAKGTVSLYHKGKKTTVHKAKPKPKAKPRAAAKRRVVVKRRPAAKRAAKRVVHRKKAAARRR